MAILLSRLFKLHGMLRLCLFIGVSIGVGIFLTFFVRFHAVMAMRTASSLIVPDNVHLVDPDTISPTKNFTCIKTKELFNMYRTTICIYSKSDPVSSAVISDGIWEEPDVKRILRILIRNPHLDMIDIGANIGAFTLFTAGALGRFTLAIDCYLPNIERIARAVQIEGIQNRVVLVHNALYSSSNKYLSVRMLEPSMLRLQNDLDEKKLSIPFLAHTIRFDDLLPILEQRGVRSALIKIDIETSESYMCESGSKIFDRIDIPYIMMEWHSFRVNYQKQYQLIIGFFALRNYVATDEHCKELETSKWLKSWPGNVFWIRKPYDKEKFC